MNDMPAGNRNLLRAPSINATKAFIIVKTNLSYGSASLKRGIIHRDLWSKNAEVDEIYNPLIILPPHLHCLRRLYAGFWRGEHSPSIPAIPPRGPESVHPKRVIRSEDGLDQNDVHFIA